MPLWFLRLLPSALTGAALVAAFWWIDYRGYARAMADRDTRDAAMLSKMQLAVRESEGRLAREIAAIDATYDRQRSALSRQHATLQPHIAKEIARETRLADPALGLTPGLLDTINLARATGACATAASGRIVCALPPAAARD